MRSQLLTLAALLCFTKGCDFGKADTDDDDDWGDEADWDGSTEEPWDGGSGSGTTSGGADSATTNGGDTGNEESGDDGWVEDGGEEGGEAGGGTDGSADSGSCQFGSSVCIETTAADPATWCWDNGGALNEGACADGYTAYCEIPAEGGVYGMYADAATAYYYDVSYAEDVCADVGGIFRDESAMDGDIDDGDGADGGGGTDDGEFEDIDGDGWTAEEGDCNDENPDTYPGAEEICDGAGEDNNCDGDADSEYEDDYEPNENIGTAYDLGEIDSDWFSGGTASLTVNDLTLDGPNDEDWFQWFVDDHSGDDPNIAIYIDGDADMYLIAELYLAEWDTTTRMVIAEGWGEVEITEDDVEFESGWWWSDFAWDNIFVRIQTNEESWTPDICETATYDLTIES